MSIKLGSREIIIISGMLGAKEIRGIPNGFQGLEGSELASVIEKTREEMEKENILLLDFNGDYEVSDNVAEAVRTIVDCKSIISFAKRDEGSGETTGCLIYGDGSSILKVDPVSDKFVLTIIARDELESLLTSSLDNEKISYETKNSYRVSMDVMVSSQKYMRKKKEYAAVKCFSDHGFDDRTAKVICDSFMEKTGLLNAVFTCYEPDNESTDGVMMLFEDGYAVSVKPEFEDVEEVVDIVSATSLEMKEEIVNLVSKYGF